MEGGGGQVKFYPYNKCVCGGGGGGGVLKRAHKKFCGSLVGGGGAHEVFTLFYRRSFSCKMWIQ